MIKVLCFGRKPAHASGSRALSAPLVFALSAEALTSHAKRLRKEDSLIVLYDAPWNLPSKGGIGIEHWVAFHQQSIQLHKTFKGRVFLVHETDHDPKKFIELCGFPLDLRRKKNSKTLENNTFVQAFFLTHLPQAVSLYRSLRGATSQACPLLNQSESAFSSESDAFRALSSALTEAGSVKPKEIQELRRTLDEKTSENHQLNSDVHLLLAQVHKIQEELELYYLKCRDMEGALEWATGYFRETRRTSLRSVWPLHEDEKNIT